MFELFIPYKAFQKMRCSENFCKESFDLLDRTCVSFNTEEELPDGYVPVRFVVTVRTDYDNEVIYPESKSFCSVVEYSHYCEHPLYDGILLTAKKFLEECFVQECLGELVSRTALLPLGTYIQDNEVFVYTNIVVDSKAKQESFFSLKENVIVTKIEDLETEDIVEAVLKSKLKVLEG